MSVLPSKPAADMDQQMVFSTALSQELPPLLLRQQQLLEGIERLNQQLQFFHELITQEVADGHVALRPSSSSHPFDIPDEPC